MTGNALRNSVAQTGRLFSTPLAGSAGTFDEFLMKQHGLTIRIYDTGITKHQVNSTLREVVFWASSHG